MKISWKLIKKPFNFLSKLFRVHEKEIDSILLDIPQVEVPPTPSYKPSKQSKVIEKPKTIKKKKKVIKKELNKTKKNPTKKKKVKPIDKKPKSSVKKEKKVKFKCFPDKLYGYNVYSKIKGAPNFTIHELLYSKTASKNKLSNIPTEDELKKLILLARKVLQPIRDQFGRVVVTSGYRSMLLCKLVGSNKNSNHIRGEAADFFVPGVKLIIVLKWIIRNLEYRELILEGSREEVKGHHPTIIHCAYRTNGNIKKLKHPITFKPTNLKEIEKYFREGQNGR